jgi:predicted DNA-binding mobile mystery protein A
MTPESRKSARKALDAQLKNAKRLLPSPPPPKGWLRAIRDGLGMTAAQFGARLGISQPSIADLERREASGTVTLAALKAAATALDCTLVYAVVPNESLEATIRKQARKAAAKRLARVAHSMRLEAQGLSDQSNREQLDELTEEIIRTEPRAIWSER